MKEFLWHVAWAVIVAVTVILWCIFRPFVLIADWRRDTIYGNTYKSLQEAIIILEYEDLDRSAWGLGPNERVIRLCPQCKTVHDGTNYCSFKCELGDKLCGFLKRAIGK